MLENTLFKVICTAAPKIAFYITIHHQSNNRLFFFLSNWLKGDSLRINQPWVYRYQFN